MRERREWAFGQRDGRPARRVALIALAVARSIPYTPASMACLAERRKREQSAPADLVIRLGRWLGHQNPA